MKKSLKKITVLVLSCIMLLAFPFQAFCLDPVYSLPFDKIEELIIGRNPDVQNNNKSYANTVDNADKTNSWGAGIVTQGYNTSKSNLQIVWNKQKAFADYNQLKRDLYLSQTKEAQLAYQLKITTLKESVGRASKEDKVKAENALSDQKRVTVKAQDDLSKALRDFNLSLNQDVSTPLTIESVPEPDLNKIRAIDFDTDYEVARLQSYDIKIVELPGSGKDQREKDIVKMQFKDSFYNIYKALKDALENYQNSQKLADIAQHDYEIARKKLSYGILSQLDFVSAEYTWTGKLADTSKAKDNLYIAYQRYQWAMRGLIFS
ncbi:MAG: hypothetical protein GX434_03635 [Peptococcaceae bacterium]|nr:hypothetical protein [Peptococcaceae bacterium]